MMIMSVSQYQAFVSAAKRANDKGRPGRSAYEDVDVKNDDVVLVTKTPDHAGADVYAEVQKSKQAPAVTATSPDNVTYACVQKDSKASAKSKLKPEVTPKPAVADKGGKQHKQKEKGKNAMKGKKGKDMHFILVPLTKEQL
ncbi:hypothetical protein BaRGS_00033680 [Batillaria attramentaria]|uniref:Uncharacterized protein n=1 Tax=Batillaria attramentaria TaxID=370345 RepID=A0ABD0JKR8_9CAEN